MTEIMAIQSPKQAIAQAKNRFIAAAERTGLDWAAESMFAIQAVKKNDYLGRIAEANPWSLMMAMINVASIGVTLNPARKLAFLVARNGEVILDISYRGLVRIAVDDGAIRWAKAVIVREKDVFKYHGPAKEPDHDFDPFDTNRGEIIGAYSLAGLPLPDDTVLCEPIRADELWQIRDLSKSSAWVTFKEEMIKKTAIKRGSKTWPSCSRLDAAIDYLNREAGEGLVTIQDQESPVPAEGVTIDGHAESVPDIPDDEEIPEAIRDYVGRVIQRCLATDLWNNGRDLVSDRYGGRFKTWALHKLDEAARGADAAREAS